MKNKLYKRDFDLMVFWYLKLYGLKAIDLRAGPSVPPDPNPFQRLAGITK
jgi:hypothetical protein